MLIANKGKADLEEFAYVEQQRKNHKVYTKRCQATTFTLKGVFLGYVHSERIAYTYGYPFLYHWRSAYFSSQETTSV
ncbi:MAG: hypothetical protein Q3M24_10135 [Candidatus Electrothrix aestuarii]|jgi:hypothetical protein|uniref:Uncharacterized protein n=1 Tax=Candidatus Electrothrix aestuarii TaxID=3062594 RepID=A0AAU8M1H3_9BACT|nr:hypothetical protein [Candidatus Electrothrix aestuarii]